MSFKILGINHIGLAPKDSAQARSFFTQVLKLSSLGEELVTSQQTNTVMIASRTDTTPGDARLEILEPQDGALGPIAKFLEARGGGIHHVALTVDNVDNAIKALVDGGVKMIDTTARPGAHNTRIAFVHPHATGGLLIELVQEMRS